MRSITISAILVLRKKHQNDMTTTDRAYQIASDLKINLRIETIFSEAHMEPSGHQGSHLDGMQILENKTHKTFEVSEYMVGPNEDELWIYGTYKNLRSAIKSMMKGNHTTGRKPEKTWT